MIFLYLYCLFALTTSCTAVYEILTPVLRLRHSEGFVVKDLPLIYLVFFILTTLVAPVIFPSCVIPSMGNRFKQSLYASLFLKD